MANNSKWYVAGVLLIGAVIGIVFVGILTSVVHWAGSPKFCGEFCHSMDLTYAAYKKGQHYMTSSGATAGCSDCHLLNTSARSTTRLFSSTRPVPAPSRFSARFRALLARMKSSSKSARKWLKPFTSR